MELTKYTHACVTLDKGGSRLLLDPGTFTPNAAELAAGAGTILITHEHFDHFDEAMIAAALEARPELRVYGPAAVVDRWQARGGQVTAVVEGERFEVDGFEVDVVGGLHAPIHQDIPQVANVGYLIDGGLYHPGDSYYVPAAPVTTPSNRQSTGRIFGCRSSALTNCISLVPGLAKQATTSLSINVSIRASAPFMPFLPTAKPFGPL